MSPAFRRGRAVRRAAAWLAVLCMAWALCWLPMLARAQAGASPLPVPPLSDRVIDQTGTLDAAQRQALVEKLAQLEATSGSQVVILMVPTTQPEDIAAYAYRVADQWKIGRREVGDGVLLVVAKNDRKVRIEVARALEGAIPDLAARQVIDRAIAPAFRAGDYAGGLSQAIDQLAARIAGEQLPAPEATPREPGTQWEDVGIFLFMGVPVIGAVLSALLGRKLGALATGAAAGALSWWWTSSLLLGGVALLGALVLVGAMGSGGRRGARHGGWHGGWHGGGWGGGGGSWGGGGGGFSSGGGGSFGGGGASGNW